jgi:hypothetical protein
MGVCPISNTARAVASRRAIIARIREAGRAGAQELMLTKPRRAERVARIHVRFDNPKPAK